MQRTNTDTIGHGQRIGSFIRATREDRGLSSQELSTRSGLPKGTISKIENGLAGRPKTDSLDRIARVLGISLAELYVAAGYEAALPSLPVYLRSQYRHLTPEQQAELTRQVVAITERYGAPASSTGPRPGEDEAD